MTKVERSGIHPLAYQGALPWLSSPTQLRGLLGRQPVRHPRKDRAPVEGATRFEFETEIRRLEAA
jgi:hypothetical protein